ncbi:MAG: hypothetical protein PF501_13025 [Salinisphaera sp.]|jgi:hypothetical protein|nr:hypothetical protein [Salinisphaera sp.]
MPEIQLLSNGACSRRPSLRAPYCFRATPYDIACHAGQSAAASTTLDGIAAPDGKLTLTDDGESHSIVVSVANDRDQQQTTRRDTCNSE